MDEFGQAERCNRQYIWVEVDEKADGQIRDEIDLMLHAANKLVRISVMATSGRNRSVRCIRRHGGICRILKESSDA